VPSMSAAEACASPTAAGLTHPQPPKHGSRH